MNLRYSIRLRLTAWYTVALVVLLTAFAIVIYLIAQAQIYASFDQALSSRLAALSSTIDYQTGSGGQATALLNHDQSSAPGSEEVVLLFAADGQLLDAAGMKLTTAQQQTLRQALADSAAHTVNLGGSLTLRTVGSRLTDGNVILILGRTTDELTQPLAGILIAYAIAAPLVVLLAALGGLFLSGRLLRPIATITHTAQEISAHDLSRRLALGPPRDELTTLAATIDQMLDRIDLAMKRERQFTADASHELRTPLATIITEAELALTQTRPPTAYRAALSSIRREGETMQQLVGDLLTLARSDDGRVAVSDEELDLLEVAANAIERIAPRARAAAVEVTLTGDERADLSARGNESQVERVLLNLLDNAIKYSAQGATVSVQVARLAAPPVAEVVSDQPTSVGPIIAVSVTDQGPGIAASHMPRLFDRFYRVDATRARDERSGAGLGLAICATIARLNHGWIGVTSAPSQGSRFTLYLPAANTNG